MCGHLCVSLLIHARMIASNARIFRAGIHAGNAGFAHVSSVSGICSGRVFGAGILRRNMHSGRTIGAYLSGISSGHMLGNVFYFIRAYLPGISSVLVSGICFPGICSDCVSSFKKSHYRSYGHIWRVRAGWAINAGAYVVGRLAGAYARTCFRHLCYAGAYVTRAVDINLDSVNTCVTFAKAHAHVCTSCVL